VSLPGATSIGLFHNHRELARLDGEEGTFEIEAGRLGLGPATVQAIGLMLAGETEQGIRPRRIRSAPLTVRIEAPPPLPGWELDPQEPLDPGLAVSGDERRPPSVARDLNPGNWLETAGFVAGDRFRATAWFDVSDTGVHQFQLPGGLDLRLSVDDQVLATPASAWNYAPVSLSAGRHRLLIEGRVPPGGGFPLRFGLTGTGPLDPRQFRHVKIKGS
jgi:hypothetical protein